MEVKGAKNRTITAYLNLIIGVIYKVTIDTAVIIVATWYHLLFELMPARVKVVIYVITMYLLAHLFPLLTILFKRTKQNIPVNQRLELFELRYGLLASYAIFMFYMLTLMISLYSVAMFVGLPYLMLIDMILVFRAHWVWTELPQNLLLEHVGMQDPWQDQPSYHIDTTQKHYPRIRHRHCIIYTGKTLFSKNEVETGKDVPDVEEVPGNHCICSFVMKLQPPDPIHSFVVYFCECQGDDTFYDLCSAFDVPESIRVKIATNNSSTIIRCLDALHRVYHRDKELTLAAIKTKLSEYSDELQQIISNYHPN